ncbi:MAG: peptidylprolyl isomerase [Pseudomonadota bacterium]|nr:peptidylprolyl isomerase [Pseudomonadota bacterium]
MLLLSNLLRAARALLSGPGRAGLGLVLMSPLFVYAQATGAQDQRAPARAVLLDRVVAVVNNEAITQHEIDDHKRVVLEQMKAQKITPPAPDVLEKQVTERLITERLMLQFAKGTGVKVDDVQVERTIERIAQENKLTAAEFRNALGREGIPYSKYREDLRNEILMQKLRDREVEERVQVTDAEVDNFLASVAAQSGGDVEYRLSHILVLAPDQGSPEQIEARRRRAEDALRQVQQGTDFAQVAASFSDAPDALQGGNLGWRAPARLPSVFAGPVRGMKPGEVSPVLRSASGFHIVKLLETRSRNQPTVVEQTHARHMLIKVNETTSEAEAKARLERIRERLETGAKFEDLARLNSEDSSSAKGGDLGWISPGDTVPDFENAMAALKPGAISAPVRTPFGWHIIQVLERRTQDITAERQREQARTALRQRKSDESFQEWLRQMRDRAFVELRPDER